MDELERFIVEAKAACYVGDGAHQASSRPASHDLGYDRDGWSYLDSYFGGTDFIGQEVVWKSGTPVWAMNYYGRVTDAEGIDAARAGSVIKQALSALYRDGRFLGGFEFETDGYRYVDENEGGYLSFLGMERIFRKNHEVYRLDYSGGLVRP